MEEKAIEDILLEDELSEENMTEEELIEKYGDIPEDIQDKPEDHDIENALDDSLEVDKDVIFDEVSE